MYVCEITDLLGDINNVQSQEIECLDNCRKQKYTGLPDKTINLIKTKYFTVIQIQYILSGRLLSRTKKYRCKSQRVGIIVENNKYTGGTEITIYWIYIQHYIVYLI
jgi:hypothetical protein